MSRQNIVTAGGATDGGDVRRVIIGLLPEHPGVRDSTLKLVMSNTSTSLPTDCGQLMSYSLSKPRICATKSVVEKMTVPTTCLSGLRKMYTKNAMNAMIPRAGIASDALDLHLEHLPPQCRYPLVQSAHTGPSYPTSHAFSP